MAAPSVGIPKMTVALGTIGVPQADVVDCTVHLGATKEVSSWEMTLQNFDGKYSPSGAYPLSVPGKTATSASAEASTFLRSLPLGRRAFPIRSRLPRATLKFRADAGVNGFSAESSPKPTAPKKEKP